MTRGAKITTAKIRGSSRGNPPTHSCFPEYFLLHFFFVFFQLPSHIWQCIICQMNNALLFVAQQQDIMFYIRMYCSINLSTSDQGGGHQKGQRRYIFLSTKKETFQYDPWKDLCFILNSCLQMREVKQNKCFSCFYMSLQNGSSAHDPIPFYTKIWACMQLFFFFFNIWVNSLKNRPRGGSAPFLLFSKYAGNHARNNGKQHEDQRQCYGGYFLFSFTSVSL